MYGQDVDLDCLVARTRAALELVHDPEVQLFKGVVPRALGAAAQAELRRRCAALLKHCWGLLESAYGIRLGAEFFSVHRPGDPLNCLALAPEAGQAEQVAAWWAGPGVMVTRVSAADPAPEAWVAMGVALHWVRPAWLP